MGDARYGGRGPSRVGMFVCAAVAVLLLAACGTRVAGASGAGTTAAGATAAATWTTFGPSDVSGARLTGGGRDLALRVEVPDGPRPCVRDLRATLQDPFDTVPHQVNVKVTFSSPAGDRSSGCTRERWTTARLRLPQALGSRTLVLNSTGPVFTAQGADPPALRLCGQLGCTPPRTGCTQDSYDQALIAVDAPNHTFIDADRCDGRWLVLTFSWGTGAACGDASGSGCSDPALGDRYFFRAGPSGWVPIADGAAGGCAVVRHVAPSFPAALCAGLAPLSPTLHPSYPPPSATGAPSR